MVASWDKKVELKELLAVSEGRIEVNAKRYFSAL